jgi:hypothetical protein
MVFADVVKRTEFMEDRNDVFSLKSGKTKETTKSTLACYDLTHLYSYDLSNPQEATRAHAEMHLVATLQGIVNRIRPRLYVRFAPDLDPWWLDLLCSPGEWLAPYRIQPISDLDSLLQHFRSFIHGAVIYDPNVPATSNVASTVAGVENLVALPYDPDPASLYSRYIRDASQSPHLDARVWLVHKDGSSLFTGQGAIPGTDLPSSGSAKCDAYLWARRHYLDSGRCMPGELGYYVDSYWLRRPDALQQATLMNHDYLVSRRGFLFDLSPWDDEAPLDDSRQSPGTDRQTLERILRSAYEQNRGEMVAIRGFVPWRWKYTNREPGGSHEPYMAEWQFVKIASAYNAYLDADAEGLDGMANASVFRHYPLQSHYPQNPRPTREELQARGFLRNDGSVTPHRYVMFYVGDYDSAAWLYQMLPRLWQDKQRGSVPLNWAFNPNLADRLAPALAYTRRTQTSNDFFIAGDSGAGYLNPGMLQEPREISGLPSGLKSWLAHCQRCYEQWDLSITGFIIDGFAPGLDQEGLATYQKFSPDGLAAQKISPHGMFGSMPYTRMGINLGGSSEDAANAILGVLNGDISQAPVEPEFHVFRTVLQNPTWHHDVVTRVQAKKPDAKIVFVDAYTFYQLLRCSLSP